MGRSYSLAGKRVEAYALYCRARTLAENALQKFQAVDNADQVCIGVGFFFFFTGLQEHFVNMFGLFLYKLIFFNRYVLCSESALVLWLVLWAFENP